MSNPLAESPSGSTIQQPPLHVLRWHDPLIDRLGHDPRSRYVERFWLGILGPSTTLVLRVFADALDETAVWPISISQTLPPRSVSVTEAGATARSPGRFSGRSGSGPPDQPVPTRSRYDIVSLPSTAARSSACRSPSRLSTSTSTNSRSLPVRLVRGHAAWR